MKLSNRQEGGSQTDRPKIKDHLQQRGSKVACERGERLDLGDKVVLHSSPFTTDAGKTGRVQNN